MGLASSKKNQDGSYGPSTISMNDKKAISCKTPLELDPGAADMYKGDQKILVLGTENSLLECRNGKNFNSGHNPTELLLPLVHLAHAGFKFEFATPTGKKFPIEEFAWAGVKACNLEDVLKKVESDNNEGLEKPIKISESLQNLLDGKYIAVFIPGGHGALNIKRDESKEDTGKILAHCHASSILTMSLCHGPDAFRCAPKNTYEGYKVCAFLDKADDTASKFGYLPGKLKEEDYPERNAIAEQGMVYQNKKNDDSVFVDRELITGSTNLAAQNFGAAAVKKLQSDLEGKGEEKTGEEKTGEE